MSYYGYMYDLGTKESEEYDQEGGDFETYTCSDCERDLPYSMNEEIDSLLFYE